MSCTACASGAVAARGQCTRCARWLARASAYAVFVRRQRWECCTQLRMQLLTAAAAQAACGTAVRLDGAAVEQEPLDQTALCHSSWAGSSVTTAGARQWCLHAGISQCCRTVQQRQSLGSIQDTRVVPSSVACGQHSHGHRRLAHLAVQNHGTW